MSVDHTQLQTLYDLIKGVPIYNTFLEFQNKKDIKDKKYFLLSEWDYETGATEFKVRALN